MDQIKPFKYQENYISFSTGDKLMVNATDMAKAFGKQPSDWTKTKQAQEFISSLSAVRNICGTELLSVSQGGNIKQGTWMHEDVAMEFARWLNPVFAIWCNDRIKELLRYGATAVNPEDLLDPDYVIQVMTALKQERQARQLAEQQVKLQSQELLTVAPKAEYFDKVLQSDSLISPTELANELGFRSAIALNKFLKEKGVIHHVNGAWAVSARYAGSNYARQRIYPYTSTTGEIKTARHLYWTERGRMFLVELTNKTRAKITAQ